MSLKMCEDFPDAPSCCQSCHEDQDYFGYELLEATIDGHEVSVCCAVLGWIEDGSE